MRRTSLSARGSGKQEFLPEPSVEGGQVFQTINPKSRNGSNLGGGHHASHGGDEALEGLQETDPENHSVSRGVRPARNALVVVQESEKDAHVASCQYPGKKDQDRFAVQLSADMASFPHYVGLFDGHGTSVFAADLCATSLLATIMERHNDVSTPIPSDDSIISAFTSLHDRVLD